MSRKKKLPSEIFWSILVKHSDANTVDVFIVDRMSAIPKLKEKTIKQKRKGETTWLRIKRESHLDRHPNMEFNAILGSEVSYACSGKRGNLEECDLFSPLFCCFLCLLKVGKRSTVTKTKRQRNLSDVWVSHVENSNVSSWKRGVPPLKPDDHGNRR